MPLVACEYGSPFDVELWRTDGTKSGTYLVHDINPGNSSLTPSNLVNVTARCSLRLASRFSPAGASTVVETVTLGYRSLALNSTGLSLQSDTEVNIPYGQIADSVTLNDSPGNDLLY